MTTPLPVLPQVIVEAGLSPDTPGQGGTTLFLGNATTGKLGTGTYGTAIAWTSISPYVLGFTVTRPSTRLAGPLWNYPAGTASITLDNSDGRFDPDNLASPYTVGGVTQMVAMVPVRIRCNFASQPYALFSGFADGWLPAQVTYEAGYAELTLPATDAFKVFGGITLAAVSITGVGAATGARITDILSRAGWYTSADRNVIANGNSTLQGTVLNDTALNLMQLAADSEIGQLYVNGAGAVTFRARHDLLTDARSNTVQAVFGDAPGAVHPAGTELACAAISRASDDTTLVNDVQATRAGGGMQEVKDTASVTQYLFPRTYPRSDLILQDDPNTLNWAQWVLYIGKTGEDRFESLQVDPAADPYNLWPQVLGREIGDRIQVWHRPPGIIDGTAWSLTNNFGSAPSNQFTIPTTSVPLITAGDTFRIFASGVLKEPTVFTVTTIGTDFFGNTAITFSPWAQAVLAVGDVVTQTGGAISKDCFIAGITHAFDAVASTWLTTWTLSDASKYGGFLVLGNPTLGQLGHNAYTW